ncbi:hypothetical protein D9V34_05315 [Mycetocola lacteus]|uniref:Uncharacterized protein n=1 Tax=Mycetocola lacteus TaxID=76637 RepID=A0A3L7AV04_9MICO|nr:hypothetical protein D9V34_05315 [Mycetocola lacteus]
MERSPSPPRSPIPPILPWRRARRRSAPGHSRCPRWNSSPAGLTARLMCVYPTRWPRFRCLRWHRGRASPPTPSH